MKCISRLLVVVLVVGGSLSTAFAQAPAERPATSAPQTVPSGPMMGGGMQEMQAAMKKMQDQMAKIRATSDPAERQKLMAEHMASMREAMGMMTKMGGMGMMQGGGMMGGEGKKSPEPRDMRGRVGMMEQRMGMMQMMMEQMMQHQDMMERRQ